MCRKSTHHTLRLRLKHNILKFLWETKHENVYLIKYKEPHGTHNKCSFADCDSVRIIIMMMMLVKSGCIMFGIGYLCHCHEFKHFDAASVSASNAGVCVCVRSVVQRLLGILYAYKFIIIRYSLSNWCDELSLALHLFALKSFGIQLIINGRMNRAPARTQTAKCNVCNFIEWKTMSAKV